MGKVIQTHSGFQNDLNSLVVEKKHDGRLGDLVLGLGEDNLRQAMADGRIDREHVVDIQEYLRRRSQQAAGATPVQPPIAPGRPRAATVDQALSDQISSYARLPLGMFEEKMANDVAFRQRAEEALSAGTLDNNAHQVVQSYFDVAQKMTRVGRGETSSHRFPQVERLKEGIEDMQSTGEFHYTLAKWTGVAGIASTLAGIGIGIANAGSIAALVTTTVQTAAAGIAAVAGAVGLTLSAPAIGIGLAIAGAVSIGLLATGVIGSPFGGGAESIVGSTALMLAAGVGLALFSGAGTLLTFAVGTPLVLGGILLYATKEIFNEGHKNKRFANHMKSELVEVEMDDANYSAFNEMHDLMSLLAGCSGRIESWHYLGSGPYKAELNIRKLELDAQVYRIGTQAYTAGIGLGGSLGMLSNIFKWGRTA